MSDSDVSQGYVTYTSYTDRFFRELSPPWINYVAALNGAAPRPIDHAFAYLELGCGFGASSVVNAGAFQQGEFHACDFNPSHIDGGRRHAAAFGITNVTFHRDSFERLLDRDLPPFDFIVLHGVYSWVGAAARGEIRRVINERLKPGGLLYLSYNCWPGWAVEIPIRRLLVELAGVERTPAGSERALRELDELSRSKLRYFTANPSAVAAVESYSKGSSNYLAHEFLNESWEPFYSIDIADEMAAAGVSYVGSATLADNHPTLVLDARAAEAIVRLATSPQQQLAIDFAVNRRFRRDVFVRGRLNLEPETIARNVNDVVIGSVGDSHTITTKVKVPRGEIGFQEDFIRDVRSLMDAGSLTIGDAVTALAGPGRDASGIVRNLTFLIAAGALMPFAQVYRPSGSSGSLKPASKVVERALADIIDRGERREVPSEVAGNGVALDPAEARAAIEASDEGVVRRLVRLGLLV